MTSESLTSATARSGIFIFIRRIVSNVIRIVAVAVLARKLDPAAFGVVALAQIAVQLLTVFGAGGVITYVICDREPDWETRTSPAFWLNVAMALAGCVIGVACLPLVHLLFPQPLVLDVILVCLLDYFIDQLGMVPEALMQRRLQFRTLAIRDTVRDLVTATLSVIMAVSGLGVWSLVLPNLIVAPFIVVFTAWVSGFVPRLALGREVWPRIFRFTRSVIGEQMLTFIGNEADTAVVGKAMGSGILGVYNLAYQLANLVGRNVTAVLSAVSTPALAVAFERKTGLGAPYRRMMRVLSLMTTPLLLGMFVLARELVLVTYGDKWLEAVPLLKIFIVFTLVRAVTSQSGVIFSVIGRPELSMKIVFWFLALYIPALVISSQWGVVAVAYCVCLSRVIIGLVSLYMSLAVIDESMAKVTVELARPFGAGLGMAVVCWLANHALFHAVPTAARIAIVIATGCVTYLALTLVLARKALEESRALIKSLIARRRAAAAPTS